MSNSIKRALAGAAVAASLAIGVAGVQADPAHASNYKKPVAVTATASSNYPTK